MFPQFGATTIGKVRSGGQSGVDRAALDAAKSMGIPICGWVPQGGWAEDMPLAPGVLAIYPELEDTGCEDVNVRTNWNVRDADVLLAFIADGHDDYLEHGTCSAGTDYTIKSAIDYGRPYFVCDIYDVLGDFGELDETRDSSLEKHVESIAKWLETLEQDNITIDIGGPRESEAPGAYAAVNKILLELFA